MKHHQDATQRSAHNSTARIEQLRQRVLALTRDHSAGDHAPAAMHEALEVLTATFAELEALSTALTQAQQAAAQQVQAQTTHLTQANAMLQNALDRAQVLLRGLHHRVKNNLQVIASLLNLQSTALHDPEIQAIFQDCQERIRAMALVHELLYHGCDPGQVNLGHYLEALAKQLYSSHRIDPERIHLSIQADEVLMEINSAIPCGLICHELLSNCLRHAFPGGRSGAITLGLWTTPAGQLTVAVHDSGIGFPEGVDFRQTKSLGLQVACLLSGQLQGTLTLTRDQGTCFTLTLPF